MRRMVWYPKQSSCMTLHSPMEPRTGRFVSQNCGFGPLNPRRALEPLPATRFNFNPALRRAHELGARIAGMAKQRSPFSGLEERLLWYDALPYLSLSRASERRLLADLTTAALPAGSDPKIPFNLARADELAAAGRPLESLTEITRVYEAGVKSFES